jgi:hypothetical protein
MYAAEETRILERGSKVYNMAGEIFRTNNEKKKKKKRKKKKRRVQNIGKEIREEFFEDAYDYIEGLY